MQKKRTILQKTPKYIGRGLAYIQHGIDTVFSWAFHTVKNTSSRKTPHDRNRIVQILKHFGGFVGDMGSEYYEFYSTLKRRAEEKRNNKHYREVEWKDKSEK